VPTAGTPHRRVALGGLSLLGCYALAKLLPWRALDGSNMVHNARSRSSQSTVPRFDGSWSLTGPVFIVGSGHCGTTLLCRLIDAHPDICCGPESEAFVRNPNRSVDRLLLTTKAYEATAAALVPLYEHTRRRAVERVLQGHCAARKPTATRWAEKTPTHVHHLAAILEAFPMARIVLMVRDGFDAICSLVRRQRAAPEWQRRYDKSLLPEPDLDVALASADRWVADNLAGSKYVDDPRVLLVKLEDLAAEPRSQLARVLQHTNLPATAGRTVRQLLRRAASSKAAPSAAGNEHRRHRHRQIRRPVSPAMLEASRWSGCTADGNITAPLRSLLECGPPNVLVPPRPPSRRDVALALSFELLMSRFGYDPWRFCRPGPRGRRLAEPGDDAVDLTPRLNASLSRSLDVGAVAPSVGDCPLGHLRVRRFVNNPLLNRTNTGLANINGPSIVAAPTWERRRLGRFYLYHASHNGDAIKLAYADSVEGPWQDAGRPALRLDALSVCKGHVGSPDVHVLRRERHVQMYFHCPVNETAVSPWGSWRGFGRGRQLTFRAASRDGGLTFRLASRTPIAPFYLRVFRVGANATLGLAMLDIKNQGVLLRSLDGVDFRQALPGRLGRMRHGCMLPIRRSRAALLFFSRIGDAPERILAARVQVNAAVVEWPPKQGRTLLEPTADEGDGAPARPSVRGSAHPPAQELRDPAALACCDGRVFLFWASGGERGVSGGELVCDSAAPAAPVEDL